MRENLQRDAPDLSWDAGITKVFARLKELCPDEETLKSLEVCSLLSSDISLADSCFSFLKANISCLMPKLEPREKGLIAPTPQRAPSTGPSNACVIPKHCLNCSILLIPTNKVVGQ